MFIILNELPNLTNLYYVKYINKKIYIVATNYLVHRDAKYESDDSIFT